MLQIGGHHLAYNFTFNGGREGATPLFFGTEPIHFSAAGIEYEPLVAQSAAMSNLAQALATQPGAKLSGTFTDVVKGVVVIPVPGKMPTGGTDTGFPMSFPTGNSDRGILYGALTPAEQALVRAAIESYASLPGAAITNPLVAAYESSAALAETYVGYAGQPDLSARGSYVRIDGPRIWMELVVQPAVADQHQASLPRAVARQAVRLRRRDRPLMKSRAAWMLALLCVARCGAALAHSAPNSFVKLSFLAQSVRAEVLVPESELAYATAAERASEPFAAYLLRHLSAETPQGAAWKVDVRSFSHTTYLEHAYLSAQVEFTPPAGASSGTFVLIDDAVTHEVRNHVVIVLARGAGNPELLGALQYPARRLAVQRPAATDSRHASRK